MTEPKTAEPWGVHEVRPGDLSPALLSHLRTLHEFEEQAEQLTAYVDAIKARLKDECLLIKPYNRPVPQSAAELAAYVDATAPIEPVLDEIVRVNAREYVLPGELFGNGKPRKIAYVANQRLDVKAVRASIPEHLLSGFYVPQTTWKLTVKR